jgi:hypothetical protein
MKRILGFILPFILTAALSAQTPSSFRYQAVARNNSGNVLDNQNVSFRISILSGSASGTIAYRETHTGKTTNAFGLVEIEIGKGTPVNGTFSAINWGSNSYFVQVEMDPAGGASYQTLSTSQLLSVAYALHAKTVETGDNWGSQTVNSNSTLTGNGAVSTPLGIADNGVNSAKIQNGAVTADKLGSNSVTEAKITAGAVTGAKIAQGGATSGQTLKWNGTVWAPGNDELGGLTLPFEETTLTTGWASAALKVSNSGNNNVMAITGHATAASGSTWGVYGRSDASDGKGVEGFASHQTGFAYGVYGLAESSGGVGVFGHTNSTTGSTVGVVGSSSSNEGTGVFGRASAQTGTTYGVHGRSVSAQGTGVYGISIATTGSSYGVQGRSASPTGAGVFGTSNAATGSAWGIFGSSGSTSGTAIGARAYSTTGTTYGIHSQVLSSSGFSGYFTGGKFYVSGNVGIGTETPQYRLDIQASGTGSTGLAVFKNSAGDEKVQIRQNSNGAGAVYVYKIGGEQTIALLGEGSSYINGGSLGIGTSSPTQALHVVGNVRVSAIGSGVYWGPVNRSIDGTFTTSTSDVRLKENVKTLNGGLNKVMQLRGVSFTWKSNPEYGNRIGFIAQEFEKVIPELVFTNEVDDYKGINYAEVTAVLVEAIKELKTENDRLKAENEKVNTRLEKIEALLNTTVKD